MSEPAIIVAHDLIEEHVASMTVSSSEQSGHRSVCLLKRPRRRSFPVDEVLVGETILRAADVASLKVGVWQ